MFMSANLAYAVYVVTVITRITDQINLRIVQVHFQRLTVLAYDWLILFTSKKSSVYRAYSLFFLRNSYIITGQ